MEKMLDQDEIDALFGAAQKTLKNEAETATPPKRIFAAVFGPSSRLTKQQVHLISVLHETFTRRLAARLGGYLHTLIEARLVSVEELPYNQFLARIPKVTYWASINLVPQDAIAALNMDLNLAFPIIDLLLGGNGRVEIEQREVTEIEEHVIEAVASIVCQEFDATWQSLVEMKFIFGQRQNQVQILRLLPPEEKILALGFEIQLPWVYGMLNFAFPAAVASMLLRKITEKWITQKRGRAPEGNTSLHRLAQQFIFPVEATLSPHSMRGLEVLGLKKGQVLDLGHLIKDPILITVAGKQLFTAHPVRVRNMRGAMIEKRASASHIPRA